MPCSNHRAIEYSPVVTTGFVVLCADLCVHTSEFECFPVVTTGQSDIALWLLQGIFYYRTIGLYTVRIVHCNTAQKSKKMKIIQKFTEWGKILNLKANSNIFGEFWECKSSLHSTNSVIFYAQSWALLPKIAQSAQILGI